MPDIRTRMGAAEVIEKLTVQNGGKTLPYLLVTEEEKKFLLQDFAKDGVFVREPLRIMDVPIVTRPPTFPVCVPDGYEVTALKEVDGAVFAFLEPKNA
jgi:hypothetical protein